MTETTISEAAVRAALARFQDPETGRSVIATNQVHRSAAERRRGVGHAGTDHLVGLAVGGNPRRIGEPTERPVSRRGRDGHGGGASPAGGKNRLGGLGGQERHRRRLRQRGRGQEFHRRLSGRRPVPGGLPGRPRWTPTSMARASRICSACRERPQVVDERIEPVEAAGMKLMSIGLLVPAGEAVIWRGPMLHTAPDPVSPRYGLGRAGLLDHRHAAGHRRRGAVAGPIVAARPGPWSSARRRTWPCWTPSRPSPCSARSICPCRHGGEHELLRLPALRRAGRHLRRRRGQAAGRRTASPLPRRSALVEGTARAGRPGPAGRGVRLSTGQGLLEAICHGLVSGLAARDAQNPRLPTLPVLECRVRSGGG